MATTQAVQSYFVENLSGKSAAAQWNFLVKEFKQMGQDMGQTWNQVANTLDAENPIFGDFETKIRQYKASAYPLSQAQIQYMAKGIAQAFVGYWWNIEFED